MLQRGLREVVNTHMEPGSSPTHRVRTVLEPGHWQAYDPFLLLNEDWFHAGTFADHPHRGFETVTYVLEGRLEHFDNRGGRGSLGAGDAQWMTAGRGVIHNENPDPQHPVHSLQLWVNLPAALKLVEPRYQDLRGSDMPVRRADGAEMRVFSGSSGDARASTSNHVPVTMVDFRLSPEAAVTQDLPAVYNGFFYLLEGSGRFGVAETKAHAGQVV